LKKFLIPVAVLAGLMAASPATALQTEVDPQTMEQKRAGKVRWDLKQQRIARRQAARAAAAAAAAETVPAPVPSSVPVVADGINWDAIAECESGQDWSYNGSSGFDGGLQFLPSTWIGAGGERYAPYAWMATREQQIAIASTLSLSNWPHCQIYA
jgi:opacity protein-like surface antigen